VARRFQPTTSHGAARCFPSFRRCAPASVAFCRAPAPPPRSLSVAPPRPRLGRFLSRPRAPASVAFCRFLSRPRAPASVAFCRAPAPPPRSLSVAPLCDSPAPPLRLPYLCRSNKIKNALRARTQQSKAAHCDLSLGCFRSAAIFFFCSLCCSA
jgi:hypothetical protein